MHSASDELFRNTIIILFVGGSILLHLGALVAGAYLFRNANSTAKKSRAAALILLGVPGFFLNPVLNLLICLPLEAHWYETNVAAFTNRSATELIEHLGTPHDILYNAGGEEWRYKPGPRYMIFHLDEFVYAQVTDGVITDTGFAD